jgi:hypothetical protein
MAIARNVRLYWESGPVNALLDTVNRPVICYVSPLV